MAAMLSAMNFSPEKRDGVMALARPQKLAMLQGYKAIKSKDGRRASVAAPKKAPSPTRPEKKEAHHHVLEAEEKILSGESSPGTRRRMQRAANAAIMTARLQT